MDNDIFTSLLVLTTPYTYALRCYLICCDAFWYSIYKIVPESEMTFQEPHTHLIFQRRIL